MVGAVGIEASVPTPPSHWINSRKNTDWGPLGAKRFATFSTAVRCESPIK